MPALSAYIRRNGDCREMMDFYRGCLGGELTLSTIKETPAAGDFPAEMQNKIMHATLKSEGITLLGSDLPDPSGHKPGNDWALSLECSSEDEVKALFHRLSKGGAVQMPPGQQFWGGFFAQFTDRFDVDWMLNYQPPRPTR